MGLKERRERNREEMRRSILDVARQLFVTEGYASVPIRRIAERIEYSKAAIYLYFKSKDHIFDALAEEGWQILLDRVRRADDEGRPALERLRRVFRGHYEFSKEYPEYYYLMFLDPSVPKVNPQAAQFHQFDDITRLIAQLFALAEQQGDLPAGTDHDTLFDVLWSTVHGTSALLVCNRLREGIDPDRAVDAALTAAMRGFAAAPPAPVALPVPTATERRSTVRVAAAKSRQLSHH